MKLLLQLDFQACAAVGILHPGMISFHSHQNFISVLSASPLIAEERGQEWQQSHQPLDLQA